MEPPPRVCAALLAAVLLLRAPGSADPPCRDCDNRSGPLPKHCPAGHFLLREPLDDTPTCTPCQPGTFMAWDNHSFESCVLCRSCDEEALQLTVRNCSAVADTECGCQPGSFPDCWDDPCRDPQEHLLCTACLDCGDHGRQPLANCSRGPQECGACLDGFYEHSDNCVPCPK